MTLNLGLIVIGLEDEGYLGVVAKHFHGEMEIGVGGITRHVDDGVTLHSVEFHEGVNPSDVLGGVVSEQFVAVFLKKVGGTVILAVEIIA